MTPNKQFNSYKEGLDLEFLREYCMEHGERRVMERGETLSSGGTDALAQGHRLVPQCYTCLSKQDPQGNHV